MRLSTAFAMLALSIAVCGCVGINLNPAPYHYSWTCSSALDRYRSTPPVSKAPPRKLPSSLISAFTMKGEIPVADYFVDDTYKGKGSHYVFGEHDVKQMIQSTHPHRMNYPKLTASQAFLIQSLHKNPLHGQHVLVFGSMTPWYEALILSWGASQVTTVEYNNLTYVHDNITTVTPRDLVIPEGGFDAAFSISSFDHDGLGRYGDPIDPVGDLRAMRVAQCVLKEGGLLFLTVPIGPDVVVYNLHRRYGSKRLPLMLDGWEILNVDGWHEELLESPASYRRTFEPVFVLRNNPDYWVKEHTAPDFDIVREEL